MKKEKLIPREKYEKKQNRKQNFIALAIGCFAILVVALLFWLLNTEKEESILTDNNGEIMAYTGAILSPSKEYLGKCTIEISGDWIYKNKVSDKIKGINMNIKVKDSDVEGVLIDIKDMDMSFNDSPDEKVFDNFTTGLTAWAENGQSVQHIATMNVYDNFQKVIIRYTDSKYIVVAPAANAEEAEAVLEYENQKLLEQFNK